MNILVVNDDGYEAEGIHILAEALKKYGNVYVMSPSIQHSGASHCITLHTHVKIHEVDNFSDGIKAWTIEGTPADCVIYALNYLNLDIDLVASGVNDGPNLGTDTVYSGTVAGAMEAIVQDIPSMAFSADFNDFDHVKRELDEVIKMILENELYNSDYMLNVNFPSVEFEKSKGIMVTEQGVRQFDQEFKVDGDKIWTRGGWKKIINPSHTDVYAYENGYTSITPLGLDRTYSKGLRKLKKIIDIKE